MTMCLAPNIDSSKKTGNLSRIAAKAPKKWTLVIPAKAGIQLA
jgi:hypothetical protein